MGGINLVPQIGGFPNLLAVLNAKALTTVITNAAVLRIILFVFIIRGFENWVIRIRIKGRILINQGCTVRVCAPLNGIAQREVLYKVVTVLDRPILVWQGPFEPAG